MYCHAVVIDQTTSLPHASTPLRAHGPSAPSHRPPALSAKADAGLSSLPAPSARSSSSATSSSALGPSICSGAAHQGPWRRHGGLRTSTASYACDGLPRGTAVPTSPRPGSRRAEREPAGGHQGPGGQVCRPNRALSQRRSVPPLLSSERSLTELVQVDSPMSTSALSSRRPRSKDSPRPRTDSS